ncbi:MAG TPA: hypothetical protein VIL83_08810 [Capillibacterium sp.]
MFFGDDGKVYYPGARRDSQGGKYDVKREIRRQELDPEKMKLLWAKYPLWKGALRDGIRPEGPHLY